MVPQFCTRGGLGRLGWSGKRPSCSAVCLLSPPSTTSCTGCRPCPAGQEALREASEECVPCRPGKGCSAGRAGWRDGSSPDPSPSPQGTSGTGGCPRLGSSGSSTGDSWWGQARTRLRSLHRCLAQHGAAAGERAGGQRAPAAPQPPMASVLSRDSTGRCLASSCDWNAQKSTYHFQTRDFCDPSFPQSLGNWAVP